MNEILDILDEELGSQYFIDFEKHIQHLPRPLNMDDFLKLESDYYRNYKRSKGPAGRSGRKISGLGLN